MNEPISRRDFLNGVLAATVFFQKYKGGRAPHRQPPIVGGEAKRNEFIVDGQRLNAHQDLAILLVRRKAATPTAPRLIGMDRSSFKYENSSWFGGARQSG